MATYKKFTSKGTIYKVKNGQRTLGQYSTLAAAKRKAQSVASKTNKKRLVAIQRVELLGYYEK